MDRQTEEDWIGKRGMETDETDSLENPSFSALLAHLPVFCPCSADATPRAHKHTPTITQSAGSV